MRQWQWLYAPIGLLVGIVLGRRFSRLSRGKSTKTRYPAVIDSSGKHRLTPKDVLRMIEENDGPEGLHLSEWDMSGIDLSHSVVREELERRGVLHTGRIPWYSTETGGINLEGAILEKAILVDAQLDQANLSRANLREAKLQRANLQRAKLTDTIFTGAQAQGVNLFRAQMQGANFFEANLAGAIIRDVSFENGELAEAVLDDVNLFGTRMLNTYVRKSQLGKRLVQEHKDYQDPVVHPMPTDWGRHRQAHSIYQHLKNNFYSLGLYDDGSWAYIKERQNKRATYHPKRARQYYGDELEQDDDGKRANKATGEMHTRRVTPRSWRWWRFYAKYTWKWLMDWAAEISCGYGERPWRTIGLAGLVMAGFPFIFWAIGNVGWFDPLLGKDVASLNFLDYIIYSAGAFATIGYEGLKPINTAAQIWTAVEAILGISILALLMFTLGNRISRS